MVVLASKFCLWLSYGGVKKKLDFLGDVSPIIGGGGVASTPVKKSRLFQIK